VRVDELFEAWELFEIRLPVRFCFGGHFSLVYSLIRRNAGAGMQRIRDWAKKVREGHSTRFRL